MAPEHSLEVPEGPGSAPEVSGMFRNGPDMSRKVLEASRRSWKVPEGSGQYHPLPCALGLLATYIKGARGEEITQVSGAPWLSLVASCSTIRPRFRALI